MLKEDDVIVLIGARHSASIGQVERLHELGMEALRGGQNAAADGDLSKALAWMFLARSTTAVRSVCNLFCLGAETDATSVFRTLIELGIDFEYIWMFDHTANVKRFIDFGKIEAYRKEQYLLKLYPEHKDETEASARAQYEELRVAQPSLPSYEDYRRNSEADFKRVAPQFTNKRGKLDTSWSRASVRERAEKVDPKGVSYELLYALGCEASHSGPSTLSDLHDALLCEPSVPQNDMLLIFSAWVYCFVLARATHVLGLPQHQMRAISDEIGIPPRIWSGEPRSD